MAQAAWERLQKWWTGTASPQLVVVGRKILVALDEWWGDMADRPRSHFISMLFALLILHIIKVAVWIAA
jgi:hypothetical protein